MLRKYYFRKFSAFCLALSLLTCWSSHSLAAVNTMGVGVPDFGFYAGSMPGAPAINVWALTGPGEPFPPGCAYLTLRASYVGIESFKIILAVLQQARAMNKSVHFFAHNSSEAGCGFDYVRMFN
jgi:hypothetical protein